MSLLRADRIVHKLRAEPFTVTTIAQGYAVSYQPEVDVIPLVSPNEGKYEAGLHRCHGFVWTFDDAEAEALLAVTAAIDLIAYYTDRTGTARKRTFSDILFAGLTIDTEGLLRETGTERTAAIAFGVPFRVQIADDETVAEHVTDVEA